MKYAAEDSYMRTLKELHTISPNIQQMIMGEKIQMFGEGYYGYKSMTTIQSKQS